MACPVPKMVILFIVVYISIGPAVAVGHGDEGATAGAVQNYKEPMVRTMTGGVFLSPATTFNTLKGL